MTDTELKELLKQGASELGLDLGESAPESFLKYFKELKTWNKKINLTSVDSDRDIIIRHFLDSLTAVPYVNGSKRLLDIGAGGGFPGIPLKIVLPELEVVLMDSVEKKVFFMRQVIRTLGLSNQKIEAVAARIEDPAVIERYKGAFDCVISRAFSELKNFLRLSLPYIEVGGRIVAIKGPAVSEELKEVEDWDKITRPEIFDVKVPFENRVNKILVFRKTA
ncbi:MAG: 16S rRNA (guanine(527)-N(7))-methyltransferase RsmG [Deltaproteobacteria bacterium]|nr:16S rRNA (guanine(527)-N(7))-methyltransferase RsmG [Deltaproteobacteria bacterium]